MAIATATGMVAGGGVAYAAFGGTDVQAVVVKVVDGDTIDVRVEGQVARVRLLNIDAPESTKAGEIECLGPEAARAMAELAPVGSEVRLVGDQTHLDGYGRTLAGVYRGETLLNAEMARRGLAVGMTVGKNAKFRPAVDEAEVQARADAVGLYSATVECTLPAQLTAAGAQLKAAIGSTGSATAIEAASAAAEKVLGLIERGTALEVRVLSEAARDGLRLQALGLKATAGALRSGAELGAVADRAIERQLAEARAAAAKKAAQERAAKKKAEQKRAAAKKAAKLRAAKKAAKERAAAEKAAAQRVADQRLADQRAAAQREADRRARAARPPASGGGGSNGGGDSNPSGYTGPRCYAPGGKTWKPC